MFSIFPKTFVFGARSLESAVCSFIQCNINPLSDLMSVHSRIFSIPKVLKHFYRWFSQQNTNTKKYKKAEKFFYDVPRLWDSNQILVKSLILIKWSGINWVSKFASPQICRLVNQHLSGKYGKHKVWKLLTIRGQVKKIWIWRMYLQLIHCV